MAAETLLLAAIKHITRDSPEDDAKWERMEWEKAMDAAYNDHKPGWVPGGPGEKGHFVRDERRREGEEDESDVPSKVSSLSDGD